MTTMEMTANQQVVNKADNVEPQEPATIARYQTPGGFTGLVVLVMDLLVRLDPR
jgi:hypothetical protein